MGAPAPRGSRWWSVEQPVYDQVIGSRGTESAARRHVDETDELSQILWYVACQSTIGQDGNLVDNALSSQCKLTSASVI